MMFGGPRVPGKQYSKQTAASAAVGLQSGSNHRMTLVFQQVQAATADAWCQLNSWECRFFQLRLREWASLFAKLQGFEKWKAFFLRCWAARSTLSLLFLDCRRARV